MRIDQRIYFSNPVTAKQGDDVVQVGNRVYVNGVEAADVTTEKPEDWNEKREAWNRGDFRRCKQSIK